MKTIILLVAILFASITNSQSIISYSPENLCVGDTVCIKLYNPNQSPFYFNISSNNGSEPLMVWYTVYPELDDADTTFNCFIVPDNLPCGKAFIGINLISQFGLHINCDCGAVNIIEHKTIFETPAVYFDCYGNRVEPRSGELLIQQAGNKRKKVVIIQ